MLRTREPLKVVENVVIPDERRFIRRENDRTKIKWGDKELSMPARVFRLIMILVIVLVVTSIVGAILLYSDWNIGPFKHDASDVPKLKAGVTK